MWLPSSGKSLYILYVGPLNYGQTSFHRMQTLQKMGHTVVGLNTHSEEAKKKSATLLSRIRHKLFFPADHAGINRQILDAVATQRFDIVWTDKGLTVRPTTLRKVKELQPHAKLLSFNPDDMFNGNWGNTSYWFWRSIPLYDLHFVTRTPNVEELYRAGAKEVYRGWKSYDPETHYPMNLTDEEKKELGGPVGFIGEYEEERAGYIQALVDAGIPVRVWSQSRKWDVLRRYSPLLKIEERNLWGDEYRKGINSFDIMLGFVRRRNRDLHTSRSLEVPGCGAFFLAVRTPDHQGLFEEGKEAEFFDSPEELVRKCRYYLEHSEERREIVLAGHGKCIKNGYDNASRLERLIEHILKEGLK